MIPFPVRWLKFGSFSFAKGRLVSRAKPNVPNAGWLKLFLKKCGGKKNKKHRVGLSVGLLAVPFEYVRYVGHLSKWFVFVLMFKIWSVCRLVNGRPTIGYNVLQLPEGGDFEALHCQPSRNFDRSTKLDLTTEPPLLGRCCCKLAFCPPSLSSRCISVLFLSFY